MKYKDSTEQPVNREEEANSATLELECAWFELVLEIALSPYVSEDDEETLQNPYAIPPPDLSNDPSPYAETIRRYDLNFAERLVLILALMPHLRPRLLDILFVDNKDINRGFTEFGGLNGAAHGGFHPTAAFFLAGDDLGLRFELLRIFDRDHCFYRENILLSPAGNGPPPAPLAGRAGR
jgi:hypothetical protein